MKSKVSHERKKGIDLIKKTKANGVVFIFGDVHWVKIPALDVEVGYTLQDVTSSGITETQHKVEPNKNRIGKAVPQNNIGMIELVNLEGKINLSFSICEKE